eukprot:9371248-Lingulodinium_polyedra.AAC.1
MASWPRRGCTMQPDPIGRNTGAKGDQCCLCLATQARGARVQAQTPQQTAFGGGAHGHRERARNI